MICDQCETVAHCMKHGCVPKQQALDKMAENARELGLDYEPAQTDWEAVAADQAMTIALLKANQPAQQQEPTVWTATRLWNRKGTWTCPADIEKDLLDGRAISAQQQEPVAYWIPKAKQFCLPSSDGTRPFAKAWEPLYTSPPAQRTWVGLPKSAFTGMTLQQVSAMQYAEQVLKDENT